LCQLCRSLQGNFLADSGYGIPDFIDNLRKFGFRHPKAPLYHAHLLGVSKIHCVADGSEFSLTHCETFTLGNHCSTSIVPLR